jgi:hypothetical protein
MNTRYHYLLFLLLLLCIGCVPLQQQLAESNAAKIEGFVGAWEIDEEKFNQQAALVVYDRATISDDLLPGNKNITYESTFGGKLVYIRNCKCLNNLSVMENKLVVTHTYGGGASNRELTVLLSNGKPYQNSKGEYIVDAILYSPFDNRKAVLQERKVLDLEPAQVKTANFIWINLLGYDGLIRYDY